MVCPRIIRLYLLFSFALIAGGCAPSPVIAPGEVDISMRRGDRLTYLPKDINGKRGYLAFDTGCSTTAISAALFTDPSQMRRRVQIDTFGTGGKILVDEVTPPVLDVGPFRLNNLSAVWLFDTTALSEAAGVTIWGAVGGDCFTSRILRVDPDTRRISLLPAGTPSSSEWGTRSVCALDGTWMFVPVVVGGQKVWCNIDTGDGGGVSIPRAAFDKIVRPGQSHSDGAATAAGISNFPSSILHLVQLFGSKVSGVTVSLTDNKYGSIGMRVLSRFVLTIDYPGRRVYARPSRIFDQQETPQRCGVGWLRRHGQVVVALVDTGGAAERAGARIGDIVLSVNGRPMESFEFLDEVPDVFAATRPMCRVVALRGDKKVEYAFSPE